MIDLTTATKEELLLLFEGLMELNYGKFTDAEVEEIKDNELLQEIKKNLSKGIYRISKTGNIIDNATNNKVE